MSDAKSDRKPTPKQIYLICHLLVKLGSERPATMTAASDVIQTLKAEPDAAAITENTRRAVERDEARMKEAA